MRGFEIKNILLNHQHTKYIFGGIFPIDLLPVRPIMQKPKLFIINTDISTGPGKHWVLIYFHPNGVASYFDSYGLPPYNSLLLTFLKQNSVRYIYNNTTIQGGLSTNCGQFCIYFAKRLGRGQNLRRILSRFRVLKPYLNDKIVSLDLFK